MNNVCYTEIDKMKAICVLFFYPWTQPYKHEK